MKSLIRRLFGQGAERATLLAESKTAPVPDAPALVFRSDATLPIVDWPALEASAPQSDDPAVHDAFWTAASRAWLLALGKALGEEFGVTASERFQLLSALDAQAASSLLDYAEKTRKRILRVLDGIAVESGSGKTCVIVLPDADRYYEYVAHYHRDDGEYALSGGSFINHGYAHFVFVQDHLSTIEPTIAHELTHCLVQHLPIPGWLNEGLAVNTERRLSPPVGRPLHTPEEMHEKHLAFWTAETIQEFWSGASWRRQDDGNSLSYDLATTFVSLIARDYPAFRAFVNAADARDAGAAAALEHLGFPLAHLAEAVLGEGPWAPDPQRWPPNT